MMTDSKFNQFLFHTQVSSTLHNRIILIKMKLSVLKSNIYFASIFTLTVKFTEYFYILRKDKKN